MVSSVPLTVCSSQHSLIDEQWFGSIEVRAHAQQVLDIVTSSIGTGTRQQEPELPVTAARQVHAHGERVEMDDTRTSTAVRPEHGHMQVRHCSHYMIST